MLRSRESIVQAVLAEGMDDWVPIDRVIGEARELASAEGRTIKEAMAGILARLIGDGLMVPGNIGEDGFEPWKDTSSALIDRVIRQSEELNWEPFGAGSWLANTAAGDLAARDTSP